MKFANPADAMRAKLQGRLHCIFCKHVLAPHPSGTWCVKQAEDPAPNVPTYGREETGQFCEHFLHNEDQE